MTEPIYIVYHSVDHKIEFWQDALNPLMPGIKLVTADQPEAQNAEVMITWNPPEGMIASLPNLKGVISLAQGVDHVLNGKTFPSHLKFARLIDPYMSEAMAEWVTLTVLEYHRDAATYRDAETRHDWIRLPPRIAARTIATVVKTAVGSMAKDSVSVSPMRSSGFRISQSVAFSVWSGQAG